MGSCRDDVRRHGIGSRRVGRLVSLAVDNESADAASIELTAFSSFGGLGRRAHRIIPRRSGLGAMRTDSTKPKPWHSLPMAPG
jgi:hypothetical protein